MKKIVNRIIVVMILTMLIFSTSISAVMAAKVDYYKIDDFQATYSVTKWPSAPVWSEPHSKSDKVYRVSKGDTIKVVARWRNSYDNTWFELDDGNFVYSGNTELKEISNSEIKNFDFLLEDAVYEIDCANFSTLTNASAKTYFVSKVREGGDWDLKSTEEWGYWYRTHFVRIDGKVYELDAATLGNILYGYTGAALFDEMTLKKAGDIVEGAGRGSNVIENVGNATMCIVVTCEAQEDIDAITSGYNYFKTGEFSGFSPLNLSTLPLA